MKRLEELKDLLRLTKMEKVVFGSQLKLIGIVLYWWRIRWYCLDGCNLLDMLLCLVVLLVFHVVVLSMFVFILKYSNIDLNMKCRLFSRWKFMVTKNNLYIKSAYKNYVAKLDPTLGQFLRLCLGWRCNTSNYY